MKGTGKGLLSRTSKEPLTVDLTSEQSHRSLVTLTNASEAFNGCSNEPQFYIVILLKAY